MIVGRTLAAITAIVALAAAITVSVVAAAFALFAVLVPLIGGAGAAAIVAAVFALIVAVLVLIIASRGHRHPRHHEPEGNFDIFGRIVDIARERPLVAAASAVAAGFLAMRNPALVATIVAAFMDKPKPKP